MAMRVFFGAVIGLIFGSLATMALIPAVAAFTAKSDKAGGITMAVIVGIGVLLGAFAPTIRRAFGRGFLMLGAGVLALPVSAFLLSMRAASDVVTESGNQTAAILGAGAASIAVTSVAALFGGFLGVILIVIGLVLALGGRREVIIVQDRREPAAPRREPIPPRR
jgi:hypothetical protein